MCQSGILKRPGAPRPRTASLPATPSSAQLSGADFVRPAAGARQHASGAVDQDFGPPCMIETTGGRLAVYQVGAGARTLVFWPSLFTDHTQYRCQAQALKDEFHMVFIDGFGHGGSGPQAPGASIEGHANALVEVLDHLQIDRAAFVGTSWGGLVGSQLARLHPQRLVALLALNTPYETRPGGPGLAERLIVIAARLFGNHGAFAGGVAKAFFAPASHRQHPQRIAAFKASMAGCIPKDMAGAARTVMWKRHNALPWLREIAVPTTVVGGAQDQSLKPADLQRAAALIPGARFIEAADSGHMSALEAPELVTSLIREIDWAPRPLEAPLEPDLSDIRTRASAHRAH